MCCHFYFVKNHQVTNNSATTEAREKRSADLEFLEFCYVCLPSLKKTIKFYHNILATNLYWQPSYSHTFNHTRYNCKSLNYKCKKSLQARALNKEVRDNKLASRIENLSLLSSLKSMFIVFLLFVDGYRDRIAQNLRFFFVK